MSPSPLCRTCRPAHEGVPDCGTRNNQACADQITRCAQLSRNDTRCAGSGGAGSLAHGVFKALTIAVVLTSNISDSRLWL